jgi:PAS domain S-box-containing protein
VQKRPHEGAGAMSENSGGRVAPGTPLRLLCVDDRQEDAELEQLSLSRAGYAVSAKRVASVQELAEALDGADYDVTLLDYTLPGWDCREALAQLLAARPEVPVISVAGTIGEETAVELLKLGAADYVSKDHLARLPYVVGRALEAAADHRARLVAEAALRSSETRYRRMVETAAEGIIIVDEHFDIVFCNERMTGMLGYEPGALLGSNSSELHVPEDREFRRDQERRRRAGESSQYQRRFRRADGSELWVNVSASPILDENGRFSGSLAMVSDISEQRDAEGRLREALSGTVAAMGALVEMRDPYTAGHERRTADLVAAIARELGLSEDEIETLDLTARMHDIGQIAVPAEILTRPGKLTDNEFTLIKAHPQVAYDILAPIDFGRPVAEVILQHHERLDGSGYPKGLRGDAIMLEARILAVADVVEAMSSHRPYRPAVGVEAALAEVAAGAGRSFDPRVVAACERVFLAGFGFEP